MRVFAAVHDAGGAAVVTAWLKRCALAGDQVACLAMGPARASAVAVLGAPIVVTDLPDLSSFDLVVCGSSGTAELERQVVSAARRVGVRCAVWLDHWVNYVSRFDDLPDELWVCDNWAAEIAALEFPGTPVDVKGNPYLEDLVTAVAMQPRVPSSKTRILYLTEPVSRGTSPGEHPRAAADTEVAALDRFLADQRGSHVSIRVRRHPAEDPDTYAGVVSRHAAELNVVLGRDTTLVEDCAWADVAVGWQTMAMVVALHCGRRVFSVAPANGPGPALPHPRRRTASSSAPWELLLPHDDGHVTTQERA